MPKAVEVPRDEHQASTQQHAKFLDKAHTGVISSTAYLAKQQLPPKAAEFIARNADLARIRLEKGQKAYEEEVQKRAQAEKLGAASAFAVVSFGNSLAESSANAEKSLLAAETARQKDA